MSRAGKIIAALCIGILLMAGYVRTAHSPDNQASKLSVIFVGFTNNPVSVWTPPNRLAVCQGATGLCALFWVTNITSSQTLWFNSSSVEYQTPSGWQTITPKNGTWSGVEGSVWTPGGGCLYAIGWPPHVPTNAVWRLKVNYGQDTGPLALILNQKLGRQLFRSQAKEGSFPSSEVTPPSSP